MEAWAGSVLGALLVIPHLCFDEGERTSEGMCLYVVDHVDYVVDHINFGMGVYGL